MYRNIVLLLASIALIYSLPGCSKSEVQLQPLDIAQSDSQKLYLKSQQELMRENYKQAYYDYKQAVSMDEGITNVNHLSSILYGWAMSKVEQEDVSLLEKQKQVWLEPKQLPLRQELVSLEVDKDKRIIHAFGIGLAPDNISNPTQRTMMARKVALADASAWVARIATWADVGVSCPFDISSETLMGMETLKEFWVDDTLYVVKVEAPVDCMRRQE